MSQPIPDYLAALPWYAPHVAWLASFRAARHAAPDGTAPRRAQLNGADLRCAKLAGADLTAADLRCADLTDADLTDADLTCADLRCADLTDADLTDADLTCADLIDVDLADADLTGADLTDADIAGARLTCAALAGATLAGADLTGADLTGADLAAADLARIRADVWRVLDSAPAEVPAVLSALRDGRVDGSTYCGPCACLVGTIANARKCDYETLPHDVTSPAERWFLAIRKGDTPESSQVSAITARWVQEWVDAHPVQA